MRARIDAYRGALDPRLGVVYRRRQLFEESVTRIAEAISAYLDREELAAQEMFPHYFEKQKTDGVDYQIYVGAGLLEDGRFDPICLKNLRLWQLMLTCGIAVRSRQLRDRLPVPLETTHLILVQHAPLSIRFRFDEKRFDVDGAYDIRYEIVKKRIDKAVVEGTSDRVTQPGKIAIIYSQSPEAHEYRALHRVPPEPGLPHQRGRGAGPGRAPGRSGPARAPRGGGHGQPGDPAARGPGPGQAIARPFGIVTALARHGRSSATGRKHPSAVRLYCPP